MGQPAELALPPHTYASAGTFESATTARQTAQVHDSEGKLMGQFAKLSGLGPPGRGRSETS